MPPRVQSPYREQTDMGFWDRSLRIVKCLYDHGKQSLRHVAQQTGISKSRVHRLRHAMACRGNAPESGLWDTEGGRQWFTRLVVATLSPFGLKRGVGVDTLREFFVRVRLHHHLGCAPTALRGVLQALEKTSVETAQAWEKEGTTTGEIRAIIGAVDATFLEHMLRIVMDLPSRVPARGRGGSGSHLCPIESCGGRAAHGPGNGGPLSRQ
jgi:hypothetical protein